MAYYVCGWSLGPIVAPFVGGYLQHHIGWQASFVVLAGYALILFLLFLLFIHETQSKSQQISITRQMNHIKCMVHSPMYWSSVFAMVFGYSLMVVFNIMGPFVIQGIFRKTPVYYGYIALILGLAYFIGTLINAHLLKTHVISSIEKYGFSIIFIACATLLLLIWIHNYSLLPFVGCIVLMYVGLSYIYPNIFAQAAYSFKHVGGISSALIVCAVTLGAFFTSILACVPHINSANTLSISLVSLCVLFFICVLWSNKTLLIKKQNDQIGGKLPDFVRPILQELLCFLIKEVQPNLLLIEEDYESLAKLYNKFLMRGYFSLYIPKSKGGVDLSREETVFLQMNLSRYGGTFAYLQAQAAHPYWFIKTHANSELAYFYHQEALSGRGPIGNATSHMRHPEKRHVTLVKDGSQYRITGNIPFSSGKGLFKYLFIGMHDESCHELYAIIPFKETNNCNGLLAFSEILNPMTMRGLGTVSIKLKDFVISKDSIIGVFPNGYLINTYRSFPPYSFPLGIAKQALELPELLNSIQENKQLIEQHQKIVGRLDSCIVKLVNDDFSSVASGFSEIYDIAFKATQFSILCIGGKSLLKKSEAQRLYRELLMWLTPKNFPEILVSYFNR